MGGPIHPPPPGLDRVKTYPWVSQFVTSNNVLKTHPWVSQFVTSNNVLKTHPWVGQLLNSNTVLKIHPWVSQFLTSNSVLLKDLPLGQSDSYTQPLLSLHGSFHQSPPKRQGID